MKTPHELHMLYARSIKQILMLQGVLAYQGKWDQVDYAIEARQRMEQMLYTLRRIRIAVGRDNRIASLKLSEPVSMLTARRIQARRGRIIVGVSVYAEAFYYFAHRAVKSLHHVEGFKRFRPHGTENVRHKLIEHPVAIHRNFTYRHPEGFRMKPYRRDGASHAFPDAGLYPNAQEFIDVLLRTLSASGMLDQHRGLVEKDRRTVRRAKTKRRE